MLETRDFSRASELPWLFSPLGFSERSFRRDFPRSVSFLLLFFVSPAPSMFLSLSLSLVFETSSGKTWVVPTASVNFWEKEILGGAKQRLARVFSIIAHQSLHHSRAAILELFSRYTLTYRVHHTCHLVSATSWLSRTHARIPIRVAPSPALTPRTALLIYALFSTPPPHLFHSLAQLSSLSIFAPSFSNERLVHFRKYLFLLDPVRPNFHSFL